MGSGEWGMGEQEEGTRIIMLLCYLAYSLLPTPYSPLSTEPPTEYFAVDTSSQLYPGVRLPVRRSLDA